MKSTRTSREKFHQLRQIIRAVCYLCTFIGIGYFAVDYYFLRAKVDFVNYCGAGNLVSECVDRYGLPRSILHDKKTGATAYCWSSMSLMKGPADIAVIHKNEVIVEVLNLDKESGESRFALNYDFE